MFLSVDYIPNNPKKRVVFSEDFEEPFLDINYWNYELGDGCPELCGWGNKELQHYTKSNIFIRNKNLVIKATRENNNFFFR
jgi:hypothetical protein